MCIAAGTEKPSLFEVYPSWPPTGLILAWVLQNKHPPRPREVLSLHRLSVCYSLQVRTGFSQRSFPTLRPRGGLNLVVELPCNPTVFRLSPLLLLFKTVQSLYSRRSKKQDKKKNHKNSRSVLFLNSYTKEGGCLADHVHGNIAWVHIAIIVTDTQTPVLGVVPAGQSDWISSRKACCAAERTDIVKTSSTFSLLHTTT